MHKRLEFLSDSSISTIILEARQVNTLYASSYPKGYSLLQLTHASELGNALGGSGGIATPALELIVSRNSTKLVENASLNVNFYTFLLISTC
jgi:hypothetical protein